MEDQAAMVQRIAATGVDAVVVIAACLAAQHEDDDAWRANCEALMRLAPGVTLGLYECPEPYHRVLQPRTLQFLARSRRFAFHKDTSRVDGVISAKLAALREVEGSPFRFYNGNVTTLLHSLREGAHGFSGVSANFYPWLHVWLVRHAKEQPERAEALQRFLSVAEMAVKSKYPSSAKLYLRLNHGLPLSHGKRAGGGAPGAGGGAAWVEEELTRLRFLYDLARDAAAAAGITVPEGLGERPEFTTAGGGTVERYVW